MKNITLNSVLVILVITCGLILSGCKDDFTSPASPAGVTVYQTISGSNNYNVLVAAINKANLSASLDNNTSGTFTLFAPSDDAFVTYFKGITGSNVTDEASAINYINALPATGTYTVTSLVSVVNSHLLNAVWTSDKLTQGLVLATLNTPVSGTTILPPGRLSVSKQGAAIVLNATATIVTADAIASNGIIHTTDKVMNAVSTASAFSTFGLSVSYSVSPATVSGGTSSTATGTTNYDLFASVIRLSGLGTTLSPNVSPLPDFTYFAPSDAAFILYAKTIDATVTDEISAYTKVISKFSPATAAALVNYHVIQGRFLTTDLANGQQIATLAGQPLTIGITGTTYTITDANTSVTDPKISSPNVLTNAGVVHQIDGVLRAN